MTVLPFAKRISQIIYLSLTHTYECHFSILHLSTLKIDNQDNKQRQNGFRPALHPLLCDSAAQNY